MKWNVVRPQIVRSASIDANNIVRVDTRSNTDAGFLLEMHHFPWTFGDEARVTNDDTWGLGPFIAIQPGSDKIISAVVTGLMIGWKLAPQGSSDRKGFGLGIGYAALPAEKTLGDEFVDGNPAPPNASAIRFEERDKGSLLILASFVF